MNGEKGWRFLTWGLLLLAWGLRVAVVTAHRLHPDEALYGYWGMLVLSGRDPWLARAAVYKPPLAPYLVAGAQWSLGVQDGRDRLAELGIVVEDRPGKPTWHVEV